MNDSISKSRALNLSPNIHAKKFSKQGVVNDCDCVTNIRFGIVRVGPKCAQERINFLNKEKMRPGHTRKTGGKNSERRLERSRLRGYMWSAENDSARVNAQRDYEVALSDEYKAQLSGIPHNKRKRVSGVTALRLAA